MVAQLKAQEEIMTKQGKLAVQVGNIEKSDRKQDAKFTEHDKTLSAQQQM